MRLSEVLENNIYEFNVSSLEDEKDVDSLGLLKYNFGKNICTFSEKIDYLEDLSPDISMIITTKEVANELVNKKRSFGMIVTDNPRVLYFKIHNYLSSLELYKRVQTDTQIGHNASISKLASIAPNNVYIGDNVVIEDFVSIKENTFIGDNSIIRSGAVVGGVGFEFKKNLNSSLSFFVEHIGGVKIGDFVEIQYNTCVDKAIYPWDDTVIDDDTKVDNLVHIAHGAKIGKHSYIVAGAKIGGRCNIGNNSWIGIGGIIRNGIDIGDNSRVNMGAVVTKNIMAGEAVTGNFAISHKQFIENMKKLNN